MASKHASSSKDTLDIEPLSTLRTWVTRKEAVATCRIDDIVRLRTVTEEHNGMRTTAKDVFFLRRFPCQMVELVAFVSGVDRKDTTLMITLDDHSGCTIPAIVFLKSVEAKMPALQQSTTTFRSAQERKVQKPKPLSSLVRRYVVPDVRVGDTVRIVGRIDQWTRSRWSGPEVIRQVAVDLVSDGGSIQTVWPEELYEHVAVVRELHRTLYSQPFVLVQPPQTAPPTPIVPSSSKSNLSSSMTSETGYESDEGPELRHPSRLPSSRLTDSTFKYYLIDHVTRETVRAMRSALRLSAETQGDSLLLQEQYVSALSERFPEYRQAMRQPQPGRVLHGALTCSTSVNTPQARRAMGTPKANSENISLATPSRAPVVGRNRDTELGSRTHPIALSSPGSPAKGEQRSGTRTDPIILSSPPTTPVRRATPHSKEIRGRGGDSPRGLVQDSGSPTPTRRKYPQDATATLDLSFCSQPQLPVFTVDSLMKAERLAVLGPLVAMRRAKKEEQAMRARAESGTSTERDKRKVQERLASGRSKGHWKLDKVELDNKFRNLTTWALRVILEEGGLIFIKAPSCAKTFGQSESYLPVPPEILAPLMAPIVQKEEARLNNVFRCKSDRQKGKSMDSDLVKNVSRSLRSWGDGRYERVGDWAVEEAYEWGRARGLY